MISLFEFLVNGKNYSCDEAEETVLRWEHGMDIPDEIKVDISEYYESFSNDQNAWCIRGKAPRFIRGLPPSGTFCRYLVDIYFFYNGYVTYFEKLCNLFLYVLLDYLIEFLLKSFRVISKIIK